MNTRTIRDFTVNNNIWSVVNDWSQKSGFVLKQSDGQNKALYQKGTGAMVAPMMFEITQTGQNVHFEAWVRANTFVRLMTFFIVPAEIQIESGGLKMVLPKKIAREAINNLLTVLNQPLIP